MKASPLVQPAFNFGMSRVFHHAKAEAVAQVEGGRGPALIEHLASRGVLATGLIGLRFVTHLDVDATGIDRAIAATAEFLKS